MNRAALQSFRQQGQAKREELRGDSVLIAWTDGTGAVSETVTAAVQRGTVRPIMKEGGWINVQPIRVDVLKTALPRRPSPGVTVTHNGTLFDIAVTISGDSPGDIAWIIRANALAA